MGTQTTSSEYMLLFRGTNWYKGLSPDEIQQVVDQVYAWFDRLTVEGVVKTGQPLVHEGRIVSGKKGRAVADGPFAESKEAIAGYFLIKAENLDEAVSIAKDYPCLNYGASVEVRKVAPRCPSDMNYEQHEEAQKEFKQATA